MSYYTGSVSRIYSPAMLAGTPLRPGSAPSAPSAQRRTSNYSDDELNPEPEPEHHSRFSPHRNRNRSRSRSRARAEEPIFLGEEGDPSPPPPGPMDHQARKAHKHKIETLRAEIKIARGMEVLWKEKKKGRLGAGRGGGGAMMAGVMGMAEQFEEQVRVEKNVAGGGGGGARKGGQRSASFGALEPQAGGAAGGGMAMAMGLLGMAEQYEHTRPQRSRAQSVSSAPAASPTVGSAPASAPSEGFLQQLERQAASPAGFAAIASVVGVAAHELHDLRQRSRSQSLAGETSPAVNASVAPAAPRAVPDSSRSSRTNSRSRSRSRNGTSTPSTSIPRPMSRQPQTQRFMSELDDHQHHAVRHAAAALLMKEPEMQHVARRSSMVAILEHGSQPGDSRPNRALFGVPLKTLIKHEATDSHHGLHPATTLRIPTFLDHCITALMQMDVTTEGILRKSGRMHQIAEIVNALDHAGGNDTLIDLAALDPVTMASIMKRFLAALPDPVLSAHLFNLFIATSHIKNIWIRKRAMHLVVCIMPRVNRDVMEVLFLFFDWLSKFAHISVKDGNQMDLSSIAKIMAPTLLRPHGRDPAPEEVPAMIAAVFNLMEDQHVYHEIPFELMHVMHVDLPRRDTRSLLKKFEDWFHHGGHQQQQQR